MDPPPPPAMPLNKGIVAFENQRMDHRETDNIPIRQPEPLNPKFNNMDFSTKMERPVRPVSLIA